MVNKSLVMLLCLVFVGTAMTVEAAVNNQPVAKMKIMPNGIYACEGTITLDGSESSDSEGAIVKYGWEINGKFVGESKIIMIGDEYKNNSGTYSVKLTVTDNGGLTDETEGSFVVKDNPAPSITELRYKKLSDSSKEKKLVFGDKFQLEARKGKSNHGEIYEWIYDEKVFKKNRDGAEVPFEVISNEASGNYEIAAFAVNACGKKSNQQSIEVEVDSGVSNTAPTPEIVIPETILEGKSFQVSSAGSKTGQGYNESGDSIEKWSWKISDFKNKEIKTSSRENPRFTIEDSGVFTANLCLTDKFGKIGCANETFIVNEAENDPPVANASATEKNADYGKNFTLNATWSYDPDGRSEDAIKRYKWFDKTYNEELCSSSRPICSVKFFRTGDHRILLTVSDNSFPTVERSIEISVKVVESSVSETGTEKPEIKTIRVVQTPKKDAIKQEEKALIDIEKIYNESSENSQGANIVAEKEKTMPGMEFNITILLFFILWLIKKRDF